MRTAYFSRRAGRALSCACRQLRPGIPDHGDHEARRGGDAAQVAQEIQRHPLRRQNTPRRAGYSGDQVAGRHSRRRLCVPGDHLDRRIDQLEGEPGQVEAGDNAGLAGHKKCRGAVACRHDASVVRSPARPRSSSKATRTSGSIMMGGRGDDIMVFLWIVRSTAFPTGRLFHGQHPLDRETCARRDTFGDRDLDAASSPARGGCCQRDASSCAGTDCRGGRIDVRVLRWPHCRSWSIRSAARRAPVVRVRRRRTCRRSSRRNRPRQARPAGIPGAPAR